MFWLFCAQIYLLPPWEIFCFVQKYRPKSKISLFLRFFPFVFAPLLKAIKGIFSHIFVSPKLLSFLFFFFCSATLQEVFGPQYSTFMQRSSQGGENCKERAPHKGTQHFIFPLRWPHMNRNFSENSIYISKINKKVIVKWVKMSQIRFLWLQGGHLLVARSTNCGVHK